MAEVRIDRLTLAVPGLSAEEGLRLGREVARRLAAKLGPGRLGPGARGGRRLGRVSVRVDGQTGGDTGALAEAIAARLAGRLG